MSDLLSSILSSMDKPPSLSSERQKNLQKQKKMFEKQQAAEKAKLKAFRQKVENQINEFIQASEQHKYKFPPMDKVHRTIVHDVADIAGLSAFAFGEDEIDRYVMIFKKEYAPSDDELAAYRKGEEWNPEKYKSFISQKTENQNEDFIQNKKMKQETLPNNDLYKIKYEKLLGRDAGKAAARIATPNKQFGFVPSEQKKDQRSIEQTLADIQAKKRLKTSNENKQET